MNKKRRKTTVCWLPIPHILCTVLEALVVFRCRFFIQTQTNIIFCCTEHLIFSAMMANKLICLDAGTQKNNCRSTYVWRKMYEGTMGGAMGLLQTFNMNDGFGEIMNKVNNCHSLIWIIVICFLNLEFLFPFRLFVAPFVSSFFFMWMAMTIKIIVRRFYIWSFTLRLPSLIRESIQEYDHYSQRFHFVRCDKWSKYLFLFYFGIWIQENDLLTNFFRCLFRWASLSASFSVLEHSWLTLKLKS